jgi:hypothetical protein
MSRVILGMKSRSYDYQAGSLTRFLLPEHHSQTQYNMAEIFGLLTQVARAVMGGSGIEKKNQQRADEIAARKRTMEAGGKPGYATHKTYSDPPVDVQDGAKKGDQKN